MAVAGWLETELSEENYVTIVMARSESSVGKVIFASNLAGNNGACSPPLPDSYRLFPFVLVSDRFIGWSVLSFLIDRHTSVNLEIALALIHPPPLGMYWVL